MTKKNTSNNSPHRSEEGLIENIVQFSHLLRDNDISVSLPAVLDTLAGLPLIDISNLQTFHCLLRSSFISCKEDLSKFDRLFYAYWLPRERTALEVPAEGAGESEDRLDSNGTAKEKMSRLQTGGDAEQKAAKKWVSRRFQYTTRGREFSLRKILRKNMQFGGELILLDFKKKKLKKRRVVFFCDVSGSMDVYTLMILQFIHALKRIDRRTEIFLFSTDLSRVTHQFEKGDFTSAVTQIPGAISDWGGGTRIGHCLKLFNETFGTRQLSAKDIVMIFSDGWDRGEIDLLDNQMAFLKRKAHKIMWLNPLMGTRDYEPICRGMSTALPYVDYFLPVGSLNDLRSISRTLKKVMV
ncbi:MAG: VWA domain-containing protein [Desulfobacterales bacterium]